MIGICFLVYANSLNNAFVFDDISGILKNPKIYQPFNLWHEPASLLNSLCYSIGKYSPPAFHLINIILHALNTILVFLFLRLFFKENSSFIAACLFALHPIHTEAVTWISGKSYIILSLFILAPLLLYYKATTTNDTKGALKISSYIFSLLIFSYFIINHYGFYFTFPLLLVLLDLTLKSWKKNWRFWLPFFVIDILKLLSGKGVILNRISTVASITGAELTQTTNPLINLVISVFSHLWLLIFPAKLTVYHDPIEFSRIAFYLCAVILILFLLSTPIIIKKARLAFFAITLFILSFAPVYSPFPVASLVAERYLYFPSIILCIFFAFLFEKYTGAGGKNKKTMAFSVLFILICIYSARTIIRNKDWKTQNSFWLSAIKDSPNSPGALNGVGLIYQKEGKIEEAIDSFRKAVLIRPKYANAYNNLGNLFVEIEKNDEAVELFKKAIEVNPKYLEAYNNLGNVYSDMGRKDEAIVLYKKVIELNAEDLDAYYNLGNTYIDMGKTGEAILSFKRAIEINPRDVSALNNLGNLYDLSGKKEEAEKLFRKAIDIDPDYAPAHSNLRRLLKTE